MDKIFIGPHLRSEVLFSEPKAIFSEEQALTRSPNRANPFGLKIQTTVYAPEIKVKHPSEGFSEEEDRYKDMGTMRNAENNPSVATQLRNHNSPSRHNKTGRGLYLLNIFKRAKMMATRIKKSLYFKDFRNMTAFQKRILDDPCVLPSEEKINFGKHFLVFILSKLEGYTLKIRRNTKPINPDLKAKKIWDVFLLLLSFINFFIFTIEISFFVADNHSSFPLAPLKYLNFICYSFDIFLNFLTGFHQGGVLIMDLDSISRHYLSQMFLFDLLAFIPMFVHLYVDEYQQNRELYFANFLFAFILNKFDKRLKDFREFLIQEQEELENFFSISILYLRTAFISHILACIWYVIGEFYGDRDSWLQAVGLLEAPWEDKYLNSLYWSVVTMVSVGYGDIVPKNNLEKMFCIGTMLIGFTVFGFTMGSFGEIIQKMNEKTGKL